jgi:hypothetical protein
MVQLKPLDPTVPIFQQISAEVSPVVSTQLHQGIAGSTVFMNYAVWESVAHFRAAFTHPEFKKAMEHYPPSAVASPHLFTRLTVPNLCVGP